MNSEPIWQEGARSFLRENGKQALRAYPWSRWHPPSPMTPAMVSLKNSSINSVNHKEGFGFAFQLGKQFSSQNTQLPISICSIESRNLQGFVLLWMNTTGVIDLISIAINWM